MEAIRSWQKSRERNHSFFRPRPDAGTGLPHVRAQKEVAKPIDKPMEVEPGSQEPQVVSNTMKVHIGVDVGGTNTDAVVVCGKTILAAVKCVTTPDVTTGVTEAIKTAVAQAKRKEKNIKINRVHIGTTHFVNAVIQRRDLQKVAVIRLCQPASLSLPPFSDIPEDLKQEIYGGMFFVSGGYQIDGQQVLSEPSEDEIVSCLKQLKKDGISNIVISAIFSPVNAKHEIWAGEIVRKHYSKASVTLSHHVGHMGLLERENAAILNESLKTLSQKTIKAFRKSLDSLGLGCPFFLTQNDGTLISAEQTLMMPVHTFSSGPTNSMRGAAFLSGLKDAIVVDIGGTSTDVGVLIAGFPREASTTVEVGGVRTNFRMPDVPSIGLGGGSLVWQDEKEGNGKVFVGPQSVGYRLLEKSKVFGGTTLTTSDIAVAAGLTDMGDKNRVANLDKSLVHEAANIWHIMLEDIIDSVKTSEPDIPVILVGGGSVLIDVHRKLKGVSELIKPAYFEVANAVGAALSQVSGFVDKLVSLTNNSRQEAIDEATSDAKAKAIKAGANPTSLQVVELSDTPIAYLPGNATKLKIKVVGDLKEEKIASKGTEYQTEGPIKQEDCEVIYVLHDKKLESTLDPSDDVPGSASGKSKQSKGFSFASRNVHEEPFVASKTGAWVLSEWDVECIAIGAGILGCGGGGNPHLGKLRTIKSIREGNVIRVMTPERICETMEEGDVVINVGFMGAPAVLYEKLFSGTETLTAVQQMMNLYNYGQYSNGTLIAPGNNTVVSKEGITCIDEFKPYPSEDVKGKVRPELKQVPRLVGITSFEIGGMNSVEPLVVAAELDLPVVDCDGMGRAFPELQMYTPVIYGADCHPGCVADEYGQVSVVLKAQTAKQVEDYFRGVCIKFGCTCAITWIPLKKEDLANKVVPHSLSRAWRLGKAVHQAARKKIDPVQAILDHEGGKLLFTGKICDVQRETTKGFDRGHLRIVGLGDFSGQTLRVDFQNENLVATMLTGDGKKVLACTPDLISVVITETGVPVPTEETRYGLRVSVVALSAHPMLCTDQALTVVGPQAFGYPASEVQYKPIGKYTAHEPVPYV